MATLLPPPPVDPADPQALTLCSMDLVAAIATGVAGACAMCRLGTIGWWDLSRCGLAPVADDTGALTDQVGLHPQCAPAVVARWLTMVAGPGGDEPSDDTGVDVVVDDPTEGDSATRADRPADVTPAVRDRAALLGGVYA